MTRPRVVVGARHTRRRERRAQHEDDQRDEPSRYRPATRAARVSIHSRHGRRYFPSAESIPPTSVISQFLLLSSVTLYVAVDCRPSGAWTVLVRTLTKESTT